MNFTVNQKQLLSALNTCAKAIGNGLVLATGCYRFTLGKRLQVSACNMQVSIATIIDAKGDKVDILIPNHVKSWITTLADQPLTFTIDGENIKIESASGNCDFVGFSAEDFPVINTDAGHTATFAFEDITEAIYRTAYSKLTDSTGNILNAISVEIEADKASFVSYNGFAFARFVLLGKFTPENFLLPDALISVLPTLSGECTVTYSPNNISFTIGDTEVKSVLMDGKYIAYKHGLVIPASIATCGRIALIDAIKRVLLFSNQLDQLVRLQFSKIGIMITGTDVKLKNNAQERLTAQCSDDLIIGVNGKMLIEALSHLSTETITLSYNLPNTPLFLHEDLNSECLAMIAPIIL